MVARGQPLLRLDAGLQQSRVLQTQSHIEQLDWRLRELRAGYREEPTPAAPVATQGTASGEGPE